MTAANQDCSIVAGDSRVLRFVVKENGAPADLAGAAALRWGCARRRADNTWPATPAVVKTLTDGVAVTDAAGGVVEVALDPLDTAGLPAGRYYHELELTDAGGAVTTLATGTLTLVADLLT